MGNISVLKPYLRKQIEHLFRRRLLYEEFLNRQISDDLIKLSREIKREISVVFNRDGNVLDVIIGDKNGTGLAKFNQYVGISAYYSKNRVVKTSFNRIISERDILILNRLRLDTLVIIGLSEPYKQPQTTAIMRRPPNAEERLMHLSLNNKENERLFSTYIEAFEEELSRFRENKVQNKKYRLAILVGCGQFLQSDITFFLRELSSLLINIDIQPVDSMWQKRAPDAALLVGYGKIQEIIYKVEYHNADLVVFFNSLSPNQKKNIEDVLGIPVMDRNQVILEIFAKRAKTSEGKIQVELASLRYQLPRLTEKDAGLSRLVGGFKTKGPGETKLELMRRQTKGRIAHLSRKVQEIRRRRIFTRQKRKLSEIPIVALVGYTNAGKSTLLNRLTGSNVYVEDRLFATLEPATRKCTFSDGFSILFSDTVGFIKGLPEELKSAFMATFEEINEADLILHIADISNRDVEQQIEAVEEILVEMGVDHIPRLLIFNKIDCIKDTSILKFKRSDGIYISAAFDIGISELLKRIRSSLCR